MLHRTCGMQLFLFIHNHLKKDLISSMILISLFVPYEILLTICILNFYALLFKCAYFIAFYSIHGRLKDEYANG